jgi:hypothetical protein
MKIKSCNKLAIKIWQVKYDMIEDGQTSSDTKSLFDLCPGEKINHM